MKLHAPSLPTALATAAALALALAAGACTTEPATPPTDLGVDTGQVDNGSGDTTTTDDTGATDTLTGDTVGDSGPTDAGTADTGLTDEGASDADAGDVAIDDAVADGVMSDADAMGDATQDVAPDVPAGPECDPACGDDAFCAATDTCLVTCGGNFDAAALVAAVGEGWTPTANLCGGGVGAWAFQPLSASAVLELRATDGDPLSTLNVDRVTFDSGAPALELISVTTAPGSVDGFTAFPSLYLELDPSATVLLYGYTGAFDMGTLTAPGAIFVGSLADPGSGPLHTVQAPSNFSVAALGASSWLVSSAGAAGNNAGTGAYLVAEADSVISATQVATNLGFANGYVAVHNDLALVGGYADPWPDLCGETAVDPGEGGNRVFAFSVAALQQAAIDAAPLDAFCDAPSVDLGSEFRFLPDGRVLSVTLDATTYLPAQIDVVSLSFDAGANTLAVTGTKPLTTSSAVSAAKGIPGASNIMLRHDAGYLLVEPSGN